MRRHRTEILHTPSAESARLPLSPRLSWSHYRLPSQVEGAHARSFYEVECLESGWSVRELQRQIGSLLFERLARSREREGVLALARDGHEVQTPHDLVKDPYVLEFLGLPDANRWVESELEQALIRIDLKVGRLTQEDVGQMLLYTGYFEAEEMREDENPPVGLILCTDKNDAVVRYTLSKSANQIFASRYQLHLPSEEELAAELRREVRALEEAR